MIKTISLDDFLSKLQNCDMITVGGHNAMNYGLLPELDYFSLFVNNNEIKFNKADNMQIPVYSREGRAFSFSFANLISDTSRTLDVSLFSYMQL